MAKKSVTHWDEVVEASKRGEKIWVGVDVHKRNDWVAVLTSGGVKFSFVTPADNAGLLRQFTSRGIVVSALAYEAGPTGFGLYRAGVEAGIEVIVAAANRIPRMPTKGAKTDRLDCEKLASYLSHGLLKPVTVPSEEQEAARSKVRYRNDLASEIGETKEKIKSFLLVHGIREPKGLSHWSEESVLELWLLVLDNDYRLTLDGLLRKLDFLLSERRRFDEDIERTVSPSKDILRTVPGVGLVTAATFRSEVFDPARFGDRETLTSYLGLAPMTRRSGEGESPSRLEPCGQGKLRSMLIEASWILMRHERWAKEMYGRILSRCGNAQKAITAIARKLAIILWRLWIESRMYRPSVFEEEEVKAAGVC